MSRAAAASHEPPMTATLRGNPVHHQGPNAQCLHTHDLSTIPGSFISMDAIVSPLINRVVESAGTGQSSQHVPGIAARCAHPSKRGGRLSPSGRSTWGLTTRSTRAADSVSAFCKSSGCMDAESLTSMTTSLHAWSCQRDADSSMCHRSSSGCRHCCRKAGAAALEASRLQGRLS